MAAKSPGKLSAAKLKEAYLSDLRAAWDLSCRTHADQTPYGFVLYGVEDPVRLYPVLLTEEGLDRAAAGYVEEGYHHTLDEARKALRWSIADSPYESDLDGMIPKVDAVVGPHADALTRGGTYAPLANAAIAALKELDSQGVFGKGKERQQLTLAILNFDMEEDWSAKSVKQLNPDAVVRRFRDETTFETEGTPANCTSLCVSRDGRSLYAAIWREDSARKRRSQIVACDLSGTHIAPRWAYTFPAHRPFPGPVACAPDDSFVLGLGAKGPASYDTVVVRLPRDSNVPTQQHEIEEMGTFALSPDGHRVAASVGRTLQVVDSAMQPIHRGAFDETVHQLQLLRSNDLLVATNLELLRIDPVRKEVAACAEIKSFRFSTDETEQIVAVSGLERDNESQIHLLRLPSLEPFGSISLPGHQAAYGALSPDGRLLAFEAHDLTKMLGNPKRCFIVVFDVASGKEISRRKPHRLPIGALKFLRDGNILAIGTSEYFATSDPIELWKIPGA